MLQRPAHLIVNTNDLLPLWMTRSLGKCCTSLCHFLAWSHVFIRLHYKRCESWAVLFSIKNHLALNKMKKQLWCGELLQQLQSNRVQLIHLYKCNIDMTITSNSYAPYSTKHLEMCLNLSIVNKSCKRVTLKVTLVIKSH